MSYQRMKDKVMEALKQHFRPEFLNRLDEVIVFHELAKHEVVQMVDLMLKRLTVQLESQGLGIELTQAAKELLAEVGYDPQLGARPLRRAIQREIEAQCGVPEVSSPEFGDELAEVEAELRAQQRVLTGELARGLRVEGDVLDDAMAALKGQQTSAPQSKTH